MQPAPSEPCEHCSRLLIHPVVTTCPRGRTAALRAIDGVRSLGREVAAELASADAAHLVAFKREADAKAKAKGRKRAGRHLPATPGCNFAEADRSPAQVHRKRETGVMPVCPLHDVIHYRGHADVPGQRLGRRFRGTRRGRALQILPGVEARTVRGVEPDRVLERRQMHVPVVSVRSALSSEDAEVLLFLLDGAKPRKIAAERGLTPRQAKTVIERIRRRLGPCEYDIRALEATWSDETQARAAVSEGSGPDVDERIMHSD